MAEKLDQRPRRYILRGEILTEVLPPNIETEEDQSKKEEEVQDGKAA